MTSTRNHRRSRAAAVTLLAALAVGTLGATQAQAAAGFTFDVRTGGATRVETAVKTSMALYPTAGSQEDVVLVNLSRTVDGLSASYLAGLKDAPILYTDTDGVPDATQKEIDRLGAKRIWLVGGTTVISQSEQDDLAKKYTVARFGGVDRYDTAARVATAGQDATGADRVYQPERVFITSGTSLADAVVVAPIAWAANYPVLLTDAGTASKFTTDALTKLGTTERTVIGGEAVVSKNTYTTLKANKRLGGTDRQATSVLVANDAVDTADFTHANVALVGGENANAVDALSASALAGSHGTPLLYIRGTDHVGTAAEAYLKANRAELTADSLGLVLGGTSAVTDNAVTEATAAAQ